MSITDYAIINKLYQWSPDQAIEAILHKYDKDRTAIISYVYWFMLVNRKLLEPQAQVITMIDKEIDFRQVLLDSDLLLPDGAALRTMRLIGKILWRRKGPNMLHNLNGTDFLPYFLDYLHASDYKVNIVTFTVYDPRLNNKKWYLKNWAINYLAKQRPRFNLHGEEILYWDTNYSQFDWSWIEKFLNESAPQAKTINLFLNFRGGSYGRPHQELFAFINKDKLKELGLLCMNQGATVDFWTGKETRAPKRIRALWLESAYRLFSNPKLNYKKFLKSFQVITLIIRKVIFVWRK